MENIELVLLAAHHVSRLKPFNVSQTTDLVQLASVDSSEYVVDSIVDHRAGSRREDWTFRVRWRGCAVVTLCNLYCVLCFTPSARGTNPPSSTDASILLLHKREKKKKEEVGDPPPR